jgi:hypothetical protein
MVLLDLKDKKPNHILILVFVFRKGCKREIGDDSEEGNMELE